LRQRSGFHDLDLVAEARDVLFIVDVADGSPANVLAVARMLDQARDLDAPRLVHLVPGDDADGRAPLAAFRLCHLFSHSPSLPRPPSSGQPVAFPAGWSAAARCPAAPS